MVWGVTKVYRVCRYGFRKALEGTWGLGVLQFRDLGFRLRGTLGLLFFQSGPVQSVHWGLGFRGVLC